MTLKQLFLPFLLCFAVATHAALPAVDSQGQPLPTLAPMLKKVTPAVVNISVTATRTVNNPLLNDPFFRHFFNSPRQQQPQQRRATSAGSGVIVDAKKGLVITNHHVIKEADEITIGLADGRTVKATLVGVDAEVDIAVLKIEADNLTALPIADSSKLEVGDFVVAIGNPFGLGQTVTTGVVSALGRMGLNMDSYENFIQTDASINPGNSGGALVNLRGELVGINTAIIAPAGGNVGIGFAIPSNMAVASKAQILEYGEVRRGRIGVYIQDLNPELAEAFGLKQQQKGVLISQVEKGGAAEKAGLKAEDIVISVDGQKVEKGAQLRNHIGMKRVGDTVNIRYLRNGKERSTNVVVEGKIGESAANDDKTPAAIARLAGVHLQNTSEGILVVGIDQNSPAARTGLQVNDVIVAANRKAVRTVDELRNTLGKEKGEQILLQIVRHNTHLYLVIR